jgi:2-keto-4-pentenoate hydratase/2-oxohepta-3-ene-1,7-dioic acid hydratase in catechol pathway
MQLVTYRGDAGALRVGLEHDGGVFDLDGALRASGAGPDVPDLLGIVTGWDAWRPPVLDAAERVRQGGGPDPVEGAHITVPFPAPRRDAFAIGGNYAKHVENAEQTTGVALTKRKGATFFMKPVGTFIGPTDTIEIDPSFATQVDYEVELAVVLGRGGRDIAVDDALEHVFGYMVCNDVSARDIMLRNKPMIDHFRGKGLDTFMPMGPGVTPREWLPDHRGLALRLRVNGETRQDSTTSDMVRDVPEIIAELSRSLSLFAGDIIATGTPHGVAQESDDPQWLADGDIVETEASSLGTLVNPVRMRTP